MKKTNPSLIPVIVFILGMTIPSCTRTQISNNNGVDERKTIESSQKNLVAPFTFGGTSGSGRTVVDDQTVGSTVKLEIKIWGAYTYGEINSVNISVDSGFVMIGGGAQVTDTFNSGSSVNAVLTSAYPICDGTWSTYAADSKDHGTAYAHRLWVYIIGMKLFSSTGSTIPTSSITSHLHVDSSVSAEADHPITTAGVPNGYSMISGGAYIDWKDYGTWGNLLVQDGFYTAATPPMTSSGKDQNHVSEATVTAYDISYDNQSITNFGTLSIKYGASSATITQHLQSLSQNTTVSGYLLSGIGANSTYTGNGRLLYAMYPNSALEATASSKDQITSDISGSINIVISQIAP